MKLLKHQRIVLDFILKKCKKQHGIIVNHVMGSGKTRTAIAFLNSFPENLKKIVILPRNYEGIWFEESKKIKVNVNFIFIEYKDILLYGRDFYKDSVIVVDEAHNLYKIIDDFFENSKKEELINLLDILYSCQKIMMLTGTIIRDNKIEDIRWLINIAAGKDKGVVPYDKSLFSSKMLKVNNFDVAWLNGVREIIQFDPLGIIPEKLNLNFKEETLSSFVFSALLTISKTKIKNPKLSISKESLTLKTLGNKLKLLLNNKDNLQSLFLIFLFFITPIIIKKTREIYNERYGFEELDSKKFISMNLNKYISYYDYSSSKDYPSVENKVKKVNYTDNQISLLIKMLGIPDNLTDEEYVDLEIFEKIKEAELFRDSSKVYSNYKDKGRIVGNLYENPLKFLEILEIIKKGEQNVIYSNFYKSGILLISNFLKVNDIKHSIFEGDQKILKDFKDRKIKVLLIHPDFYEGISILGARNLHVLEPILKVNQREQVYARVVRYKSHSHLPKDKRKVTIYNWGCTLRDELDKIRQTKRLILEWVDRVDRYQGIFSMLSFFKETFSPDDLTLYSTVRRTKIIESFKKTISEISIENS